MTTEDKAAALTRQIAAYDGMARRLREMIEAPHWKIRRGELVLDAEGQPVPDPRPAREAQSLLDQITRDRNRLSGQASGPRQLDAGGLDAPGGASP